MGKDGANVRFHTHAFGGYGRYTCVSARDTSAAAVYIGHSAFGVSVHGTLALLAAVYIARAFRGYVHETLLSSSFPPQQQQQQCSTLYTSRRTGDDGCYHLLPLAVQWRARLLLYSTLTVNSVRCYTTCPPQSSSSSSSSSSSRRLCTYTTQQHPYR